MNKIIWDDSLSVGVKLIDDDHKKLISIINTLFSAIENEEEPYSLEAVFSEIEAYTNFHFTREEELIKDKCDADEYEKHVKQHKSFISAIPVLKNKLLNSSSKEVSLEVSEFLSHWLLDHIVTEDLSLAHSFLADESHQNTKSENKLDEVCNSIVSTINQKISLPKRAFIIILIPFTTLLLISGILSFDVYKKYTDLSYVEEVSKSVICINRIIDDIQTERGLSNGYIVSEYTHFKQQLKLQRQNSSESLLECRHSVMNLNRYSNKIIDEDLNDFISAVKTLELTRSEVDNKSISSSDMMKKYTGFVEILIKLVKDASNMNSAENKNIGSTLLALLQLKENYGLLRAEGAAVLQNRRSDIDLFKSLTDSNTAYLKAVEFLAPKPIVDELYSINTSNESLYIKKMQESVLFEKIESSKESAQIWFEYMSVKIEKYKNIIDKIIDTSNKITSASKDESIFFMQVLWVSLILILSLTFFIVFALKQSIVKPIKVITESMKRLARGDKTFYYNTYRSNDVIGEMVDTFENFRRALIKADLADVLLAIQEQKAEGFEKLAHLDPLTNALNRRKFRELFKQEHEKADSLDVPLSILALDIDKFKKINDTYGHDIGDKVLTKFTKLVHDSIRPSDHLARIGGEEFSVLLPLTTNELAVEIAQRIRKDVESLDLKYIDVDLSLSVSIGVYTFKKGDSIEDMIKNADNKLYESKNAGRNKVSF